MHAAPRQCRNDTREDEPYCQRDAHPTEAARQDICRPVRLGIREMRSAVSQPRFRMVLLGAFAGMALVLAVVGLYGVLSTVVRQRTARWMR